MFYNAYINICEFIVSAVVEVLYYIYIYTYTHTQHENTYNYAYSHAINIIIHIIMIVVVHFSTHIIDIIIYKRAFIY